MSKVRSVLESLFQIDEGGRYEDIASEIMRQLKVGGVFNSPYSFYGMNSFVAGEDKPKTAEELKEFEGTPWEADKFMGKGNLGFVTFKASGSKMKRGAKVKIALNAKDLYDMTFYKIGNGTFKIVKQFSDVYAEDLDDRLKDVLG